MMDNNYILLSQINSEADETLAETIWGKPANDIITGITAVPLKSRSII